MDLASLLYRALESPYGLIISSPEPDRLLPRLYAARKALPAASVLHFVRVDGQLWIVKDAPREL